MQYLQYLLVYSALIVMVFMVGLMVVGLGVGLWRNLPHPHPTKLHLRHPH
jgi:hypothetical protein